MIGIDARANESIAAKYGVQGRLDDGALSDFPKRILQHLDAGASELSEAHAGFVEAGGVVELAKELHDAEFVVHHGWGVAGVETVSSVVQNSA
jgi:hypothetical protein